ncbi:DUF3883 domain-containing protein [Hungatella effluvii]|uniref:DUF3883 domain-containing protein n=1 Tax=Hungatella effluvii TaxID=1096246 RepID=UPI0022E71892|nr:DUF3883 domain-containing protein [Hungatella effluvii]
MEYVEAILYHKIQDSDFTNMYGIKKPKGGGGQTYIQAAGYDRAELDRMFADSDIVTDTIEFWDSDKIYPRKKYQFMATAVGTSSSELIELAPRTGRKDYRISRQNLKHRHLAWQTSSDFPEPQKSFINEANKRIYLYEKNYPGVIDYLYILIIKTTLEDNAYRYYAAYVNSETLPPDWPSGAGLEQIFKKQKKQGIIFFDDCYLRFINRKNHPFESGCAADSDINFAALPPNLNDAVNDAVEYAEQDISITTNLDGIHFKLVAIPEGKRRTARTPGSSSRKNTNYEHSNKNKKAIGDFGEMLALELERQRLENSGHADLAAKIRHISQTEGDGLGYDIISYDKFENRYEEIYIEVKATTGSPDKPFDISANEADVSSLKGDHYYIYRFFGLHQGIKESSYYVMKGPVKDNFHLEPTSYRAYLKA